MSSSSECEDIDRAFASAVTKSEDETIFDETSSSHIRGDFLLNIVRKSWFLDYKKLIGFIEMGDGTLHETFNVS